MGVRNVYKKEKGAKKDMLIDKLIGNEKVRSVKEMMKMVSSEDIDEVIMRLPYTSRESRRMVKESLEFLGLMTEDELEAIREVMELTGQETDISLLRALAEEELGFSKKLDGIYCCYFGNSNVCVEVGTLRVVWSENLGFEENSSWDEEEYWYYYNGFYTQEILQNESDKTYMKEKLQRDIRKREYIEDIKTILSGCSADFNAVKERLKEKGFYIDCVEEVTCFACENCCHYDPDSKDENCKHCQYNNNLYGQYEIETADEEAIHMEIIDSSLHTYRIIIGGQHYVADLVDQTIKNMTRAITWKGVLGALRLLKEKDFDEVRQDIINYMQEFEVMDETGWHTDVVLSKYNNEGDYVAFIPMNGRWGCRICIDDFWGQKIIRNIMLVDK